MATWPASIPFKFMVGTWQEQPERNIAEFTPDVGPPKRRKRTSFASSLVSFVLPALNANQVTVLLNFHRNTLKDGSLTFDATHPRTKISATWEFNEAPAISDLGAIQTLKSTATDAQLSTRLLMYRVAVSLRQLPTI